MKRMNRTVENLLTWAPIGAAVALILSDHRRIGLAVAAVTPTTIAILHPRATRRALRAVPRGFEECGVATGKTFRHLGRDLGHSFKEAGKGLSWLAS